MWEMFIEIHYTLQLVVDLRPTHHFRLPKRSLRSDAVDAADLAV